MKESSSNQPPFTDRIRSWARTHAYGGPKSAGSSSNPTLPLSNSPANNNIDDTTTDSSQHNADTTNGTASRGHGSSDQRLANGLQDKTKDAGRSASSASQAEGQGAVLEPENEKTEAGKKKPNIAKRFLKTTKKILFSSWINLGLVFVPAGIAVANIPNPNAGATFGINAVAIIPLAALLAYATESVAHKLGDTIGALLNVTFGNAVELIIFIIALVKGEIRIVQASLLGSILSNLLLILGGAFLLGGLRFREQVYNSTVTQMSACLLSLSVISLVLPTAFHYSFAADRTERADSDTLKVSRAISVILLLVYVLYLLFQLKSHAYMYESTPQHIIDEESTPGPAAAWLDTSSSDSSSSSDSDSDSSAHSKNTMTRRVKRAIRRRRRKSSSASIDSDDERTRTRTSSFNNTSPVIEGSKSGESSSGRAGFFPRMNSHGSEDAIEEEDVRPGKSHRKHRHSKSKRKHRRHRKTSTPLEPEEVPEENIAGLEPGAAREEPVNGEPRRVDFADTTILAADGTAETASVGTKRPFNNFRALSFRPVANRVVPPVFAHNMHKPGENTPAPTGPVPRVRYGIRRTNSLPDKLNQLQYRPPGGMFPAKVPPSAIAPAVAEEETHEEDLSRPAAIILLLVSTALVAVCAEFLVDSIQEVVETSSISETFIGLILLPIVGNAAEHVTAITVAMKNKMDLAIGVAIGSSIQIALFVTPLVVIIGWIINQPMTLYFTLFETVCLFVSAFIINFLILDGRSNYLEGALLVATYVIIAIIAFFFPEGDLADSLSA